METSVAFLSPQSDPPAKRAILAAGLSLFAERGIDGVSVRDIAERSGFTNPALFRHFESKDALALALFETCYRRLIAAFEGARNAGVRSAFERSLILIDEAPEAVHYVLENLRRFFRALPQELRSRSLPGQMRRLVVEDAGGDLRPSLNPDLAVVMVLGTLAQVARSAHFGELEASSSELAEPLWQMLRGGIGH